METENIKDMNALEQAFNQGHFLHAYDLARQKLDAGCKELQVKKLAVLSLAKSGFTLQALELLNALKPIDSYGTNEVEDAFFLPIRARLEKDLGLEGEPQSAAKHFEAAYSFYMRSFEITGEYYPCINAAALALWLGKQSKAQGLAVSCLECAFEDDYFSFATKAEANLILMRLPEVKQFLEQALAYQPSVEKKSSTWKQLKKTCEILDVDLAVIEALMPKALLRFIGNMPGSSWTEEVEIALRQKVSDALINLQPDYAYGALAAGADILICEELIKQNIAYTIVLPLSIDDFVDYSVQPFGSSWRVRFEHCLNAASQVKYASSEGQAADGFAMRQCSHFTMGLSILHAKALGADPIQLSIWNGTNSQKAGGTSEDIAIWHDQGLQQAIINAQGDEVLTPSMAHVGARMGVGVGAHAAGEQGDDKREIRAILFADFKGFSQLDELGVQEFFQNDLAQVAKILEAEGDAILHKNTWGDGLFIIFKDIDGAAEVAIALAKIKFNQLELRQGLHVAAVRAVWDPITHRTTYIGPEVSFASRIEPITPAGTIFVTEAFAANAMLLKDRECKFNYMGLVDLAKNAGNVPMFQLIDIE